MTWISAAVLILMGVLSLVVALLLPLATFRAGLNLSEDVRDTRRATWFAVIWVTAILMISGALAVFGVLRDFSVPPPLGILMLLVTCSTIALAFSGFGARLASGISLGALIGFQFFRLFVELILWGLHAEGFVPVQMTFEGYNFDVITALTGAVVGYMVYREWLADWVIIAWNLLGLGLLLTIMTISVLSTPLPVRFFEAEPQNMIVAEFPFVWIPLLFVQAALFGHLLVFRALRANR